MHTLSALKKLWIRRNDEKLIESLMILNAYFRSSMTQVEMAEAVGMTQQAISLIVRGERRQDEYKIYLNLASNVIVGLIMEPILKYKFVKTYGEENKLCYSRKRSEQ